MSKKLKIGLALGSGGARGLAHIGVIKVLTEAGIEIDYIAGSSFGAWIGAWYARDKNITSVERLSLQMDWKRMVNILSDFSIGGGMIGGEKGEKFIRETLGDVKFEDLLIPFAAVTTDLRSGEKVVLRSGDVARSTRASMSVPLIFKPTLLNGKMLGDGGLVEPVPVASVRAMGADIVVAINLDAHHLLLSRREKIDNLFSVSQQCFNIARYNMADRDVAGADVVVEPDTKVGGIVGWKEFLNAKKIIKSGEEAMRLKLNQLKSKLK